jgi:hypothetical protein
MKLYVKERPETTWELTSGAHPTVYAMDMVLTNYPGIDEGQIMMYVKVPDFSLLKGVGFSTAKKN